MRAPAPTVVLGASSTGDSASRSKPAGRTSCQFSPVTSGVASAGCVTRQMNRGCCLAQATSATQQRSAHTSNGNDVGSSSASARPLLQRSASAAAAAPRTNTARRDGRSGATFSALLNTSARTRGAAQRGAARVLRAVQPLTPRTACATKTGSAATVVRMVRMVRPAAAAHAAEHARRERLLSWLVTRASGKKQTQASATAQGASAMILT